MRSNIYSSELFLVVRNWAVAYLPNVFLACAILYLWIRFSRIMVRAIDIWLQKWWVDQSARKFLMSLVRLLIYLILIIIVATMMWIEMTSFVAILWAAWLAIGLALQWSLANLAWGLLILFFKPYVIGDFISVKGEKWTVDDISIFTTKLITPERKEAIIPNGKIVEDTIINMTREGKIRVDVFVGVSYDTDIDHARTVLLEMLRSHHLVMEEPAPAIHVTELADSSIKLIVRSYCHPTDYRTVFFETTEWAKKSLDIAKIHIPFPQRVVHTTTKI